MLLFKITSSSALLLVFCSIQTTRINLLDELKQFTAGSHTHDSTFTNLTKERISGEKKGFSDPEKIEWIHGREVYGKKKKKKKFKENPV